jgi:hypothetical protein
MRTGLGEQQAVVPARGDVVDLEALRQLHLD